MAVLPDNIPLNISHRLCRGEGVTYVNVESPFWQGSNERNVDCFSAPFTNLYPQPCSDTFMMSFSALLRYHL